MTLPPPAPERLDEPPLDDADVAPPPALPIQSALYILPDGRVRFGALFEELVPVARALDPTQSFSCPVEDSSEPS